MDRFVFYSPTLFAFGDGEEQNTGALVKRFGGSRVLLVYGGGSVKRNGAYDAVTASLQAEGIPYFELSGVQANPRRRAMPARAVTSGWAKSISQPKTSTANLAKRITSWFMTNSIHAGITTARPAPWAQS